MSVKRDPNTGRWFFRTTVQYADGRRERVYGTPGVTGPFHDLAQSKVGALEAEHRAIVEAASGTAITRVEATATEAPVAKTIREHAETFVDTYRPESKASEKREKRRVLKSHLLPFFGDITIENLRQTDVDTHAGKALARGMSIKTVNNQLAVLSTLIKYVGIAPAQKLRFKLSGAIGEIHAVDPDDVNTLLATCEDPRYHAVILLASEAGLRAGEIRGLQWTDQKQGMFTIRRALDKMTNAITPPNHDKTRTVPVSPRLSAVLAKLPRRACGDLRGRWIVRRLRSDDRRRERAVCEREGAASG